MFIKLSKILLLSLAIIVGGFLFGPSFTYASNHQILTPSGYKDISIVKVGDEVVSYDAKTGQKIINTIEKKETITPKNYNYWKQDAKGNNVTYVQIPFTFYLINGKYELFKNQSLWANKRVIHAFELKVGDTIYDDNNQAVKVVSIKKLENETQWVRITISGDHSYIADDIRLHNASRYWVGGGSSVNWSATVNTNWGTASNTQDNASVPGSADDVFFDGVGTGASNSTLSADITISTLNMTGYINTLTHNSAVTLTIAGNTFKLVSGMTYTLGNASTSALSFTATAGITAITTGTKTLGNVTINGSGSTFQLQDNLTSGGNSGWTYTAGTIDTNSKTITLSSAASPIFAGGGQTYFELDLTGSATAIVTGVNTFTNLNRTGTAAKTGILQLNSNQTVSGVLTLAGNSAANRILVQSQTLGTAVTITNTGATMTWSNVDFRDITLGTSFDASGITGKSGDAGGNSGITFTTAATQYWKTTTTGSKNWSTAGNWFLATNGGGGAGRVPLPQDNVVFDASSIGATSTTVTADMPRAGKSVDWTGATNSPTFSINSASNTFYGSLTLISGMTFTTGNTPSFEGRGSFTLTTAGKTFGNITVQTIGGTLTLQDSLTATNGSGIFTLNNGTFDANGNNVTAGVFSSSNSNTRTLTMGSGTWTVTGNNQTIWIFGTTTGLTFNNGNAIVCNYSGATGTRTLNPGNLAEGSAPSFNITAGTDNLAINTTSFGSLDFTGFSGSLGNGTRTMYGSLTISSGMTVTAGANVNTFAATSGTKTITTNGISLDIPFTFNGVGGTWQLQDALSLGSTNGNIILTNGTLNANNKDLTARTFSSNNSNTRVITMGSGTWTLTGTGTVWTTATTTGLTLSGNTSTIVVNNSTATSKTFAGGGVTTFNNITFSGDNITVSGSNTFAIMAVNTAGLTNGLLLTSGTTQTVTGFSTNGASGSLAKLVSTTAASAATLSKSSGSVCVDFMSIKDSAATGGATWTAGANSTNVSGNSGWSFTAGTTTLDQKHFKFYRDNAGLNSADFYAAEDANYNVGVSNTFRLRIETANTGTCGASVTRRLEFKEDAGAWTQITTATNNVRLSDSSNFTDGAATTARLTSVGTFTAGQGKDTSSDTSVITIETSINTEDEYSLILQSTAAGHSYQFRITNAGTALTTYTVTPQISTPDNTPPVPSGFNPATTSTIKTATPIIYYSLDEAGDCKASTTNASYSAMSGSDCTGDGSSAGQCLMPTLGSNGSKTIYFACQDTWGNQDTSGTTHSVTYTLTLSSGTTNPSFKLKGSLKFKGSLIFK